MTNQQGAPEALRLAKEITELMCSNEAAARRLAAAADELRRLHAENEHLAAQVEAQQPAPPAASKAVLAAIRAANMQLVRTGDDEFMLVTLKQATPQADNQPAAVVIECGNLYAKVKLTDEAFGTTKVGDKFYKTHAADNVLESAARLLESQHTWITNVAAANLVRSLAVSKQ